MKQPDHERQTGFWGTKEALQPRSQVLKDALGKRTERKSVSHMLLTIRQACEQLQISRWTLNRLVGAGELTSMKIGSRRYISREAIVAFIQNREKVEGGKV